jgi:hypothetical protein
MLIYLCKKKPDNNEKLTILNFKRRNSALIFKMIQLKSCYALVTYKGF